jgi:aryl-alcohol dehydrogenase-like predicted oxidoreductase
MSVVDVALGFVLAHPAVTAAIIGPRTMEQWKSQADAGDIVLPSEILDKIDAIVPPGVNVARGDNGYTPAALQRPWERRRPPA